MSKSFIRETVWKFHGFYISNVFKSWRSSQTFQIVASPCFFRGLNLRIAGFKHARVHFSSLFVSRGISFHFFCKKSSLFISLFELSIHWFHLKLVQFLQFVCSIEWLRLRSRKKNQKVVCVNRKGTIWQNRLGSCETCGLLELATGFLSKS